jgi:probable rRNA maturation factor
MLTLSATAKGPLPRIPFDAITRRVLGTKYTASLVLCGDHLSRRLNRTYRQKDYPTNVLSFPLNKTEGEIFLNLAKARREAHSLGLKENSWVTYLFIHGLLHLKGHDHGSTMEHIERQLLKEYDVLKDPKANRYFSS